MTKKCTWTFEKKAEKTFNKLDISIRRKILLGFKGNIDLSVISTMNVLWYSLLILEKRNYLQIIIVISFFFYL